ncbi:hypothetical protein [Pseudomonas syringae]|uniref:hypothetical protein n=1 Tax=Pseudomonas syringae TaxID=317 RepID=UPI003F74DF6D
MPQHFSATFPRRPADDHNCPSFSINALINRNYFVSAFIRIIILAYRIELVSPEHLHDVFDIEKVRFSLSNRRNLTLTSCAVHILTYLGLGTGIPRAIDAWQMITLDDDRQDNPRSGDYLAAAKSGTLAALSRDQVGAKSGPSGD